MLLSGSPLTFSPSSTFFVMRCAASNSFGTAFSPWVSIYLGKDYISLLYNPALKILVDYFGRDEIGTTDRACRWYQTVRRAVNDPYRTGNRRHRLELRRLQRQGSVPSQRSNNRTGVARFRRFRACRGPRFPSEVHKQFTETKPRKSNNTIAKMTEICAEI